MNHDPINRINGTNGHKHSHPFHGHQWNPKINGVTSIVDFHTDQKKPALSETDEPVIEWLESLGLFVLSDRKVIQRENRQFCMRMIDFLANSRKTRLAHVDLDRHELVVQFSNPDTNRATAALILGQAVRMAAMPVRRKSAVRFDSFWSCFTAFVSDLGLITTWYSSEMGKGRIRIFSDSLIESEITPANLTHMIPSIYSARQKFFSHGMNIRFDPDSIRPLDLVGAIDTVCRMESIHILPDEDENPLASISLPVRVWHLSLAAFSFGGAIVGLIVPGIPTVPFILLTSYHLAKGSTRIHHFFLKLPLFGSVAHDWSDGRYIRLSNKIMLILLTAGIVVVTLLLTEITIGLLITVTTVFLITSWSVMAAPSHPQSGVIPTVGMSRGLRALPGLA